MPAPAILSRWLKKEPTAVGLDVGVYSVKAVLLKRASNDGLTLLQHAAEVLPEGADEAQRVRTLQKVLQGMVPAKERLAVAVGGPGTVVRTVVIPKMTPAELKAALNFEAEKYIPFQLAEVFLDSAILGDQPGGRMEIVLAAARKDLVHSRMELLGAVGITPRGIDLESVALANAWEVSPVEGFGAGPVVLLHLGARGTILNFLSEKQLQFTREIPVGGQAFTQAVAEGLGVDLKEAERLKCGPGDRAEAVRAALQPSWEKWLSQCRASFDFYENQFGKRVAHLVLSGGAARLAGFREWLQETMALPARLWNPLSGLAASAPPSETEALVFGIAVGLAASPLS